MAEQLTPHEALERITEVARRESSLQARVEGLAWIVWGLILCLQMLHTSMGASQPLVRISPLVWHFAGIATCIGIWRASGLDLDKRRAAHALGYFIGMPLFVGVSLHLMVGFDSVVIGGIAVGAFILAVMVTKPSAFTRVGRLTSLALGGLAAFLGVVAIITPLEPTTMGVLLGVSWLFAGLFALLSG